MNLVDPGSLPRSTTKLVAHYRGCKQDACTLADLHGLIERGRTFPTIYADPPWKYRDTGARAAAEKHYRTMPLGEIAALPVGALASRNCFLFLWTTDAFLPDALSVLKGWGFQYGGTFVWIKPGLGCGSRWRITHEILLTGIRGKRKTFADDPTKRTKSWAAIRLRRRRHSAKPEGVRRRIERNSIPGPRLELFGRRIVPGWVVWGDEVPHSAFEAEEALQFPAAANTGIPALRRVAL